MLPEGWDLFYFGEIAKVGSGQVDPKQEPYASMIHIGPENIESGTGRIVSPQRCSDLGLISGKYEFDEKAVIYSKIRPHLNKVCFPGFKGVCSADAYPIWPDEARVLPEYLKHYMLGRAFEKRAVACSMRTGMPKINREDLDGIPVVVPPLAEQSRIAKILSTWDQAIAKSEQLVAASAQRRLLLSQQILTGKVRLENFPATGRKQKTPYGDLPIEWAYRRIGEVGAEVSKKLGDGEPHPVLSCTKHKGLVDSLEYFNKQVFSADTSTYKVVPRGCFVYATNHIDEGSIGYQNLYDFGLVSPMYTVFRADGDVDDAYLFALLKTEHYRQIFASATNASVDRRGSLRWKDFRNLKIPLPPKDEQRAIANVLTRASEEVDLLQVQLDLLREEKSALMSQLLTGKRRVKLLKAEAEAQA